MEKPLKSVEQIIDDLRRDVAHWKGEVARLRTEGDTDLVETYEGWIREAERVLSRWDP
jgi:hypothetical protein